MDTEKMSLLSIPEESIDGMWDEKAAVPYNQGGLSGPSLGAPKEKPRK